MGTYFGFTKDEVRMLAERHDMDFDELEKWYDGYQIGDELSMFNPNSVMQAISRRRCRSFWAGTASFDNVVSYIQRDFDGLKDDVIEMLAGGRVSLTPQASKTTWRTSAAAMTCSPCSSISDTCHMTGRRKNAIFPIAK